MAKKLNLTDCRTSKDYDRVIRRSGQDYVERQNGTSHKVYKFVQKGVSVPIPQHSGEIPPGTRRSIAKMLALVGLGAVLWIGVCQISSLIGIWLA